MIRTIVARPFETVRRWSGGVPTDLGIVAAFVVLAATLLAVVEVGSALARAVVGFPLLFFAPGYVTVAALFPRSRPGGTALVRQTRTVSDVERVALSFGVSLALLPLLGLGIAASPWTYGQSVIVGAVSGFVLVGVAVAAVRRSRVPRSERYRARLGEQAVTLREWTFGSDSKAQTAVSLLLVLSMVLAVTTVGYALVAPQEGEQYTDVQLLTETEDGEHVAANYPETFVQGEPQELTLALENHEREETSYEVVLAVERVDTDGERATVLERQELDRFETTLDDGETWHHQHDVAPETVGEDLRMSYYVYAGEAPDEADADSAYEHVYLWIDVESADE